MKCFSPIFGAVIVLAAARTVFGQLITSLNFQHAVVVTEADNGASTISTVDGTSVPFQQSVSTTGREGGTVAATYSITDSGSVATLDISASGNLNTYDGGLSESQYGNGTQLVFSQPVNYTLELSATGGGNLMFYLNNAGAYINVTVVDSTQYYSGILYSRTADPLAFLETWSINNTPPNPPTNQTGSDTIDFTFYATQPIPEPSSAVLIGLPALALLGRRSRTARPHCG